MPLAAQVPPGQSSPEPLPLWFALASTRQAALRPDPRKISAIRWVQLNDQAGWAADCYDPQMDRFTRKLAAALDTPVP